MECSKCNKGQMIPDNTRLLLSYPPKVRYECDNCDCVDFVTATSDIITVITPVVINFNYTYTVLL